jgi:hypothetical protein
MLVNVEIIKTAEKCMYVTRKGWLAYLLKQREGKLNDA